MKHAVEYNGEIVILDVPRPQCGDNEVVVKNYYSAVSVGTDKSGLERSGSLIKRVLKDKDLREKGLKIIKNKGLIKTLKAVHKESKYQFDIPFQK